MGAKPEGPIQWKQRPATGEHEKATHALNVEDEQKAHGNTPKKVGGHGQGGSGH